MVEPGLRRVSATERTQRAAPPRAWVWATALLLAVAFRPLWLASLEPPGLDRFESWLFRPSELPAAAILALAGWLLWRRRARLAAAAGPVRPLLAGVPAALAILPFAWALLTRAPELMFPALSLLLLAWGLAVGGAGGGRALALPAGVLWLGVPIPGALLHEIVWGLQRAVARGTGALLEGLGFEVVREGVVLHYAGQAFQVIDGCSGLQGMLILLAISLLVRDLFPDGGRRRWLLAAAALPLGHALNVVRIALIALTADPSAMPGEGPGEHTTQGLVVLVAGTFALYGLALALVGLGGGAAREAARAAGEGGARGPWRSAAGVCAVLALLSLGLNPFAPPPEPGSISFPASGPGWTSERLDSDLHFLGLLLPGRHLYRIYDRPDEAPAPRRVEIFALVESAGPPYTGSLFSSKLRWPGPEWTLERSKRRADPVLGLDLAHSEFARATSSAAAVSYRWVFGDRGLWRESWRDLLALEASPFRRAQPRVSMRLVAFAPLGRQLGRIEARRRLDRFVADFAEPLSRLGQRAE